MSRPKLLDLMCGAGGCSVGYARAGFDVTGVDALHHEDYPFPFLLADALDMERYGFLGGFDVVAASPPCPRYSRSTPTHRRDDHPDLVGPVRAMLRRWGGLYVIENVPGAPLENPVQLCGSSFGLRVRRHRLFESNVMLLAPPCQHRRQGTPVGVHGDHADARQHLRPGTGTSRGVKATSIADAQDALGCGWITGWDDLTDAIPPAFTQHIGEQLLAHLASVSGSRETA